MQGHASHRKTIHSVVPWHGYKLKPKVNKGFPYAEYDRTCVPLKKIFTMIYKDASLREHCH